MRYTVTYTIQYDIVVENYDEAREHVKSMAKDLINFSFADVIKAEIKEKQEEKNANIQSRRIRQDTLW